MTFKHLCYAGVSVACILSSCVDDKYDLSDIDTTVRVNVNDLTVPVNLDEILLSSIIEEGDRIKVVNGEYAVTQDGIFQSSGVEIASFTIKSERLRPTEATIPFVPSAVSAAEAGYFDIDCPAQQFHFNAGGIPAEITAIDRVGGNLSFHFDFSLEGITSVARKVEFRDLVLQLPKGLSVVQDNGGDYNAATGEFTLPTRSLSSENMVIVVTADAADFNELGAKFDYDNHSIEVSGDFYVKSGKIVINREDIIAGSNPTSLKLTIGYEIPDFPLSTFSGRIKYDITGVNISDVDLSDLPDVLGQKGTDIRLANPQIYLNVTNPLQPYKLYAQTGLTITSKHGNQSVPYSIDESYFTIGNNHSDGVYNFCLAPSDPAKKLAGYEGAEFVPFTDLSKVLSGDGMPSSLGIELDNPCLPDQPVENLRLGTQLGEIHGSYSFLAPIALEQGSKIVYADDMDDWDTEDLEYLTITKLEIKASITSELPLDLDIAAYPIDKNGNQINNVEIEGVKLAASSQPQDVTIRITGSITGLAGIHFEAVAEAGASEQVLRPDMSIKVSKLRPTVTGYYEKEL